MLQHRKIRLWMPVAPCGKFWMKSKISVSFALSRQIVSKPRCFNELKKFSFIWSPLPVPPDVLPVVDAGLVTIAVVASVEVAEAGGGGGGKSLVVVFELTSHVLLSLLEKLLFVIDWFEAGKKWECHYHKYSKPWTQCAPSIQHIFIQ